MTSAHSIRTTRIRRRRLRLGTLGLALFILALSLVAGCMNKEKLVEPARLQSPYERTQLWAVAPFANESGVSIVKPDRIADLFVEQAEQIAGVETIPVNRVLLAMRRMHMAAITTPAEAMSLMNVLGLDGLIVGTVTAYDPYHPPKLGVAIQLYRRDRPEHASDLDPVELTRSRTEIPALGALASNAPVAHASGVFDASNHQTLAQLDEYAAGRTEPNSAYGKRMHVVNMEMYTQFVAYRLLGDVLERERTRLQPETTHTTMRR